MPERIGAGRPHRSPPPPRLSARGAGRLLASVLALGSGAEACGSGGGGGIAPPAEVRLPGFPAFASESIATLDAGGLEAVLETGAGAYCAETRRRGSVPSAPDYVLGVLPLASIDELCRPSTTPPELSLAALWVSGYFGGIWLRDSLDGVEAASLRAAAGGSPLAAPVFGALSAVASDRLALAGSPDPGALLASRREGLPLLLALYGYNFGYLEVILEQPPPGLAAPEEAIVCDGFLGCRSPALPLATYHRYAGALDALAEPPDPAWEELAALTDRFGEGSVDGGRGVWDSILGRSEISPGTYATLVDLSGGFLSVSGATVLAGMSGWAEGDAEAAACAARAEAGLLVWAGSYFTGLAASDPPGTFPDLVCP